MNTLDTLECSFRAYAVRTLQKPQIAGELLYCTPTQQTTYSRGLLQATIPTSHTNPICNGQIYKLQRSINKIVRSRTLRAVSEHVHASND